MPQKGDGARSTDDQQEYSHQKTGRGELGYADAGGNGIGADHLHGLDRDGDAEVARVAANGVARTTRGHQALQAVRDLAGAVDRDTLDGEQLVPDANARLLAGRRGGETGGQQTVGRVTPDSPAARAGLKAGDVIVELNGQPIGNATGLERVAASLRPAEPVTLVYMHRGRFVREELSL